jgi:hypothetical protein
VKVVGDCIFKRGSLLVAVEPRATISLYEHTVRRSAMARQWAQLAHIARHRYHCPVQFAGVLTTHTSRNRGMKPRDAHKTLVRALAHRVGSSVPDLPRR